MKTNIITKEELDNLKAAITTSLNGLQEIVKSTSADKSTYLAFGTMWAVVEVLKGRRPTEAEIIEYAVKKHFYPGADKPM